MSFVYAFEKDMQYGSTKFMHECMHACVRCLAALQNIKKQVTMFYFSYPFLSFSLFLMAVLISVFIERTFGFVTHPRRSLLCIIAFSK